MATNRIQFFKTIDTPSCLEWLRGLSSLPAERIEELMRLGAVYIEKERITEDRELREGFTLRLHREPKRYPQALRDWKARILAAEEDFFVVNKPAGVPAHPTLDNLSENMLFQLVLTYGEKLYPVQRLDTETSGVCVIARRPQFQAAFHRLLKDRETEKIYAAVTSQAPPLGRHRHYMLKQKRPPHLIFAEDGENRKLCELEVLETESFHGGGTSGLEVSGAKGQSRPVKSRLRLITGRTHQIRAQLAYLGCPLIGDPIYASQASGDFRLHSMKLRFSYRGQLREFTSCPDWE